MIRSERSFWLLAATIFAVLISINYAPVFTGRIPFPSELVLQFPAWDEYQTRDSRQGVADIGDVTDYFYIFHAVSSRMIREGSLPLWNPHIMWGFPLQAEPQSALFYPLHAVYYVFSVPVAYTLMLMSRLFLAAMFMTLLMRSIGASRSGSIISGILFAFSGFAIAWQGQAMGDALIWLPLICYSVRRLHLEPSRMALLLAAVAFAMPTLAGHPETALHVTLAGTISALLLWIFPADKNIRRLDWRFLGSFLLCGLLALALSSVQTIPTLEWVSQTRRSLDAIWPSLKVRDLYGLISRDNQAMFNGLGLHIPVAAGYMGMITFFLAALGLMHSARRYVGWLAGLIVFGACVSYGIDPLRWLMEQIPVYKGLKNERLILFINFAMAGLAGYGVSVLQDGFRARRTKLMAWLLTAAVFLVLIAAFYKMQRSVVYKAEFMRRPSFSRAMLIAGAIPIAWGLLRGRKARGLTWVVGAVASFDLVTCAYGYTAFTPVKDLFPPAPVFDFLKAQGDPFTFRVTRAGGWAYSANSAMMYGLHSVNGYEVITSEAMKRYGHDLFEDREDGVNLIGEKILLNRDRRLDMLNLKYLVVVTNAPEYPQFLSAPERFPLVFQRGQVAVFENKNVLPRTFFVGANGIRISEDMNTQLQWITDPEFDPLHTVVLPELPPDLADGQETAAPAGDGVLEVQHSSATRYGLRVKATTPGIVVVSQNYFPGWKARIGERTAAVLPANLALTGIAVPPGEHLVEFFYDPLSFKIGMVVSLIGLAAAVGVMSFELSVMSRNARRNGFQGP